MASRSRSFSKLASEDEDGIGAAAAAACSAEASQLTQLLAPVAALEAWLVDAAEACGLPAQVGPTDDTDGDGDTALVRAQHRQ